MASLARDPFYHQLDFFDLQTEEVRGHPFMTSKQKSGFDTPLPVHMRPHEPDPPSLPLVDVHMRSTFSLSIRVGYRKDLWIELN